MAEKSSDRQPSRSTSRGDDFFGEDVPSTQEVDSYDEAEERKALQNCAAPEWFITSTIISRKESRKQYKQMDR
eukprot:5852466-Karenia_brevis.AAC.1